MKAPLVVRPPRRDEVGRVWEMVGSLARYEKLQHEVAGSAERLAAHLFSERAPIECRVAERDGALVGYALFFPIYSSFHTRPSLWLDDLFVEDGMRGGGVGRALLAAIAGVALEAAASDWAGWSWTGTALRSSSTTGWARDPAPRRGCNTASMQRRCGI